MTLTPATITYHSRVKCIDDEWNYLSKGKAYGVIQVEDSDETIFVLDNGGEIQIVDSRFTPCNEDGSDIENKCHLRCKGCGSWVDGKTKHICLGMYQKLNQGEAELNKTLKEISELQEEKKPKLIDNVSGMVADNIIGDKLNELIDAVNLIHNK